MPEPVDIYSDQFQINTSPYGCTLNFLVSSAMPPAPGAVQQVDRLATVRMSLEHLKMMIYILHRQVQSYEQQTGTRIPIPAQVLNGLQIGREDWDSFWE